MFTIRFATQTYRPNSAVTLRTSVTGWDADIPGAYADDAWVFRVATPDFQPGFAFKFVLDREYWMLGADLSLAPADGGTYLYGDDAVSFPPITEVLVDDSVVQRIFFRPDLDEQHTFDVIIVGSGVGGGILGDQLADRGVDVLILEAGSYLFPTHVANLPREHRVGRFEKNVWGLYDRFKVVNYANGDGSRYAGGQAFNLGGKSVFWGGLIPRMAWWETDQWPQVIKWYLEDGGYQRAEDELNRMPQPPTAYQQDTKQLLRQSLPDHNHFDAPLAVQSADPNLTTIPTGMFSTADLLMEAVLTDDPRGRRPAITLNHAVVQVETEGATATRVVAYDLIAQRTRAFRARYVVLAAGTVESTKIAQLSGLGDPNGRIGAGITDHPIFFTHFCIPPTAPHNAATGCSKTLAQHKQAARDAHPYNMVLELGADLNQGRYLDPHILDEHRQLKGNTMLCEIVFLFGAPLVEANRIAQRGPSYVKPTVWMQRSASADAFRQEVGAIKDAVIAQFGGEAITGETLDLNEAALGGVAHEVGTLRTGGAEEGVVDSDLKFLAYENLYACDLSVFPMSPAANPTLTLAALAIRLADHLKGRL